MTEPVTITKSQKIAQDITSLLRARNPLIWIVTREEERVESYVQVAAASAGYQFITWDVAAGCVKGDGEAIEDTTDIAAALGKAKQFAEDTDNSTRTAWVLRDAPVWLRDMPGAAPQRALRNLARLLPKVGKDNAQAVIVISPNGNVPDELAGHTTVIEWPLPDRTEIADILDGLVEGLPEGIERPTNGARDAAIDAAVGLTGLEAEGCFKKSLVQLRKIDPEAVAAEKRRVVTREKVLEWFDPLPGGLDSVGGLEGLKSWLAVRKNAYSAKAREFGLPLPKGTALVGIPGCGKSLTAKAIATNWGVPLLRLDLGSLKSKFVGDSEQNLRKALQVVEAIGRCVLWIDEIEKALQGATSGSADGGVSTDALGTLLSWAQERKGGAFIVATANDVSALPPELLRKGRFDEVFFIDLPTASERASVVKAALKANGRGDVKIDLDAVAKASENFTGSEIAELVPTALYAAFVDNAREITTADLIAAAGDVFPLSKARPEKISELRKWGAEKARPASLQAAKAQVAKGSKIDL